MLGQTFFVKFNGALSNYGEAVPCKIVITGVDSILKIRNRIAEEYRIEGGISILNSLEEFNACESEQVFFGANIPKMIYADNLLSVGVA